MADLTIGGVYFNEDLDAKFGGKIGIGTDAGDFNADADDLVVGGGTGNTGLTIHSGTAGYGSIYFADGTADDATEKRGQIRYLQGTERMDFHTDNVATAALSLDLSQNATFAGKVSVGTNILMNNNTELRWKDSSGTERTMLELDSSNNTYLGTSAGGNLYLVNGASYTTAVTIDTSQNATFVGNIVLDDASGAAPQVQWINGSDDTGAMYLNSSGKLQIVTGGSLRQEISSGSTEFTGNVIPAGDSIYDLGTSSYYWANAYIDAITTTGNITVGGSITIPEYINHTGDGNTNFGFGGADDFRVTVGGTKRLNVTTTAVEIEANLSISGDGSNAATLTETGDGLLTIATVDDFVIDCGSDITLDAGGNDIRLFKDGTEYGKFKNDSSDLSLYSSIQDKDILFKGNDGGSTITALQLDMSEGGNATFAGSITGKDDGIIIDSASGPYGRIHGTSSIFLGGVSTSNVQLSAALIPDADSSRSLGSSTRYWSHGYMDAITTTGDVTVGGTLTVEGADAITIPDYILHAGDDSKFGFPSNDNFKIRLAGSDLFTMSTTTATFAGAVYLNSVAATLTIGETSETDSTTLWTNNSDTFYIQQDVAGAKMQVETDSFVVKKVGASENIAIFTADGAVKLYYNASKKFETTDTGATVTGDISITGGDITTNGVQTFSNSSSSDALLIGDTSGGDTISTIDLWVMGTSQVQVEDGAFKIQNNCTLQLDSGSDIALNGDANIRLDASIAANQSSGIVLPLGSTSVTVNNVYYWKSSSVWELTDADTESKTNGLLAYANSSGTASSNRMVLKGIVFDSGHGFTIGAPLYIHTTAGALSNTAPSGTADCVRVVGYAITSDEIYFCPDNTWVKVS